ncbi:hypothetical protein BBK82_07260 [Lentzea guizhouensis]|uniref:Translation initiation factor 2 n=1 Tax=Lentzea guizhouensis TaxID=1586287 RepID=A0A1B2HDZ2_9PSEU|nr:hypothetical protein BBK82_07260 [Lentzea guizhouensis]
MWFAVDPGSRFSGRLRERLCAAGALLLSWEKVDQYEFDLVVAASENSDLARLHGPIVLLPHGAGYHRRSPGNPKWPSGLSATALIRNGRVVPRTIVVASDDQLEVMRSVDPRLLPRALVAGDPCLDRLRMSLPHRELHRHAFRADSRRLILICSTWGPFSLYGHRPELAEQLVTCLPADEYRVVLTLHPNVWERHGRFQINAWLRRAVAAGLIVIPAAGDWRPAVLAADLVVSDHGSLTFYSAAIGLPTLVATDGGKEVMPGSPMADLLARLPRLTNNHRQEVANAPLPNLDTAVRTPTKNVLSAHLYTLLNLPGLQHTPAPAAVPAPDIEVPSPLHFQVKLISVRQQQHGSAEVTLERTTASWQCGRSFLTASEDCTDLTVLERAGAIYTDRRFPTPTAASDHARRLLRTYPGARIAIVALDEDHVAFAVKENIHSARTTVPVSATAAAVHWWSTVPLAERPTRIQLHAGALAGTVVIESPSEA